MGRRIAWVVLAVLAVAAGFWLVAKLTRSDSADRTMAENLRQIQSLPYLRWVPADGTGTVHDGVTWIRPDRSSHGVNFYSSRPASKACLMDMEGRILHEWASPLGREDGWHHVELGTNGDLFALVKDSLLLKLNWNSELQWATNIAAHHDVAVAENGDLFALTRRTVRIPYPPGDLPLLVDFITVLSPDGKVRAEHSLLDYFADRVTESQKRKIANLVEKSPKYESKIVESSLFDVFHANSVEILDRDRGALFRKGQVLVSLLMLNTVAVLDLERKTVVWSWGEGVLEWQHHPTLLPGGNMLIFDNGTHKKFSRIVELDPVRREIAWTYQAEPKESFFSGSRGGNQGLPNGNVLITESDRGRAFEVTRQGETVWEFYNPDTQQGSKGEAPRRAAIYRLMRYDNAGLQRFGLDRRGIRTSRP